MRDLRSGDIISGPTFPKPVEVLATVAIGTLLTHLKTLVECGLLLAGWASINLWPRAEPRGDRRKPNVVGQPLFNRLDLRAELINQLPQILGDTNSSSLR